MRLLDTKTKQLKTFYGDYIPQYAILSHMWGSEEDEVLFRHIIGSDAEKLEGKMRKGYKKIEGACKRAVEDELAYIWIDTCCIDKASSVELSEAINSMYEWYRKSAVCYVYLEDVRSGGDEQAESDKDVIFPIVPFERSRWFSRGWTLQELIAPKSLVFFSKGWVDIGTRTGLEDTISAVTRIRVRMLTAYDPEQASVAEKMSWAAFRETTRVEDIAYCMMGLLGVNMPLLYGEGNRAFRRLQEEFMKSSDDDSLFAWKGHRFKLDYDHSDLDNSRGMLAAYPWEFRDAMNIVQSKDGAYSPYSMTNQGLKIKLPLLPIGPGERSIIDNNYRDIFKTILNCTVRDRTPTRWIAIYLIKIREGHYKRIFPHWLDETETPPNEMELTSLLVREARVYSGTTDNYYYTPSMPINAIEIKILPTMSGFTLYGDSLVKGKKIDTHSTSGVDVIFENQGKRFGVEICGSSLDFIDIINNWGKESQSCRYYNLYMKEGSLAHLRRRYLGRLSEKIPGEDWWVTASVKTKYLGFSGYNYKHHVVIDIQREPIGAKGWYIPPAILTSDTFFDAFLDNDLDHHNVHPDFKKEGCKWFVTFNPKVKRVLDVSPVYSIICRSPMHCTQFSHDGKYLAAGGSDMAQVYDMGTGAEICAFKLHSNICTSICFSPDGNFVATGHSGGRIKLWDVHTQYIHKAFNSDLNAHSENITFLCFSPDGHLMISGSKDSDTIQIWDIADGISRSLTIKRGTHLQSIAVSPNGSLLATGCSSGIIQILDMLTTQPLEEFEHGGEVVIAFTPDGEGLVSGSTDKTLRYWNVSGLVPTVIAKGEIEGPCDSGASSSGMLAVSDVREINRHTMTFTGHKGPVTSVAVSHDGRWIISKSTFESDHRNRARNRNSVLFWDIKNAAAQFVLERPGPAFPSCPSPQVGMSTFATITNNWVVQVWRYDNIEPQDNLNSNPFLMY